MWPLELVRASTVRVVVLCVWLYGVCGCVGGVGYGGYMGVGDVLGVGGWVCS